MKSLRSTCVLEYNVPEVLVSIRIPSSEVLKVQAEAGVAEVNCRTFFSKAIPKPTVPNDVSLLGAERGSAPVFAKPLFTNRYDNIIDQLERKYYCDSVVQPAHGEDTESDESESPANENLKLLNAKDRKRSNFADDYDMDDPFIDDEEMILEVEAEIKKNRTKTKHDGFFVSSGKLEVLLSPKKGQKSASLGTNKSGTSSSSQPSSGKAHGAVASVPVVSEATLSTTAATITGGEGGEAKESKKRKRRSKKEIEEAALLKAQKKQQHGLVPGQAPGEGDKVLSPAQLAGRSATPMLASLSNASSLFSGTSRVVPGVSAGGVGGPASTTTATAPASAQSSSHPAADPGATMDGPPGTAALRPKVEKEAWQPNEMVLGAIEAFRAQFAASGIKLAKSSNIPKSLEEALHAVDCAVLSHLSAEALARTSGYYEALQSAMGGEVQTGKIRSLMVRLRLRDRAAVTLQGIEDTIRALMTDLKAAVVPCPEKLQPSFKAAKKEKAQQAKAADCSSAGGAGGAGGGAGGGMSSPEATAGVVSVSEEPSSLVSAAAQCLVDLQGPSASTQLNTNEPTTLDQLQPQPESQPKEVGSPLAAGACSTTVPLVRYEWVCNWTRPMKVSLCQVEQGLKLWVVQENQYREKLTVHDKKYMEDADVRTVMYCDVL